MFFYTRFHLSRKSAWKFGGGVVLSFHPCDTVVRVPGRAVTAGFLGFPSLVGVVAIRIGAIVVVVVVF